MRFRRNTPMPPFRRLSCHNARRTIPVTPSAPSATTTTAIMTGGLYRGAVERLAHHPGQVAGEERLAHEGDALRQDAVLPQDVLGMARHEHDAGRRPEERHPLIELLPVHVR